MFEIEVTAQYQKWFSTLRDAGARARIDMRIHRLQLGNPGDVRAVGSGVAELRLDYGPGYRVYFMRKGKTVYLLLAGGDKRSKFKDIRMALELAGKVGDDE